MKEVSGGEILRWSKLSEDNAQLYNRYVGVKQEADAAWAARDGAAYTGLALMRTRLRWEIAQRM
jgi:hypothetical protein